MSSIDSVSSSSSVKPSSSSGDVSSSSCCHGAGDGDGESVWKSPSFDANPEVTEKFGFHECCIKPGQLLQGADNLKGSMTTIADVDCYRVGSNKHRVVVVATDVFGLLASNPKLISDVISAADFTVIIPRILKDDMDPNKRVEWSGIRDWLSRNSTQRAGKILDNVVGGLKAEGFTSVSVIGYCYGARCAYDILCRNPHGLIRCAVLCHPTFLSLGDGARLPAGSRALMNLASDEWTYKRDLQRDFEEGAKKASAWLQVIYYQDTRHGFAVRPQDDVQPEKAKKDIDAATVNIIKYLELNA